MNLEFSDTDSLSSFSTKSGAIDDLDKDLFGGIRDSKLTPKKKSVSFGQREDSQTKIGGSILKTTETSEIAKSKSEPVQNKSLDDFLGDFSDKDDPLDGLLSSESEAISKPSGTKPTEQSSKPEPKKSFIEPIQSKTSFPSNAGGTGLSFSDEDSLLDFAGPAKMKPVKEIDNDPPKETVEKPKPAPPKKPESQKSSSIGFPNGAAGLGLGFTDDESDLTLSEHPTKEKSKRAISPVQEEKNDEEWLNELLGKPDGKAKPETKSDPNLNRPNNKKDRLFQESLEFSGKSIDFSDDDTEQFLIEKRKQKNIKKISKEAPEETPKEAILDNDLTNNQQMQNQHKPIEKQNQHIRTSNQAESSFKPHPFEQSPQNPAKKISTETFEIDRLRHENERLMRLSENSQQATMARLSMESNDEIEKLRHRIEIMRSENMEHVNRLKKVHQDSVDLMKNEFQSQIVRLKTIHTDEIEALKSASGTTTDVKDILVKVDMATGSLHTIAERIESGQGRAGNNSELLGELNKFMGVIKLERKQFESERERMLHFVTEMDRFNREQRDLSENEKFRYQSEIQRIETERRLLEDERRKLQNEIMRKNEENVQYKNRLLEQHQKQLIEMAEERQKIAREWAELKTTKESILDLLKPEALSKHEENVRQAAASAAESRVMKRELDFKLEQLNERRAELKTDLEMMKSERAEVARQKSHLKRDEESLKAKYSDFLSDTAEGRTALEAAKRIESQLDEKRQRIDMAIENLKSERLLLRHERQAVQNVQFNNSALGDFGHDSLAPLKPTMSALMIDDSLQADDFLNSLPPLNLTY